MDGWVWMGWVALLFINLGWVDGLARHIGLRRFAGGLRPPDPPDASTYAPHNLWPAALCWVGCTPRPPGRLRGRGIRNQQIQKNQKVHEKTRSARFFMDFLICLNLLIFFLGMRWVLDDDVLMYIFILTSSCPYAIRSSFRRVRWGQKEYMRAFTPSRHHPITRGAFLSVDVSIYYKRTKLSSSGMIF